MKMPALMTSAMAFGKYLGEKPPFTFIQIMYGKFTFLFNTLDQVIPKSAKILRRPP
jgi:hypothetical protein